MGEIRRHTKYGTPDEALVEIMFPLEDGAWHGFSAEALWAEHLDGDRYLVRSSPFYVFEISAEDVILVTQADGMFRFDTVADHSGTSTYRLFVRNTLKDPAFERYWAPLEGLDCNYEAADDHLLSIEVPPQADIEEVYALLEEGEDAGVWEFEEAHLGHVLEPSHATWRPASQA